MSALTWCFKKISWSNNSVVVLVSTAPSSLHTNLMLVVLGQNGNTKRNGVNLSTQ